MTVLWRRETCVPMFHNSNDLFFVFPNNLPGYRKKFSSLTKKLPHLFAGFMRRYIEGRVWINLLRIYYFIRVTNTCSAARDWIWFDNKIYSDKGNFTLILVQGLHVKTCKPSVLLAWIWFMIAHLYSPH